MTFWTRHRTSKAAQSESCYAPNWEEMEKSAARQSRSPSSHPSSSPHTTVELATSHKLAWSDTRSNFGSKDHEEHPYDHKQHGLRQASLQSSRHHLVHEHQGERTYHSRAGHITHIGLVRHQVQLRQQDHEEHPDDHEQHGLRQASMQSSRHHLVHEHQGQRT